MHLSPAGDLKITSPCDEKQKGAPGWCQLSQLTTLQVESFSILALMYLLLLVK